MTTRAPAPYASLTLVACERPRASDALEQLHQEWESLQSPSPGSQDAAAQQADVIYMHPLVNDRTIAMPRPDLVAFFERIGCEVAWI